MLGLGQGSSFLNSQQVVGLGWAQNYNKGNRVLTGMGQEEISSATGVMTHHAAQPKRGLKRCGPFMAGPSMPQPITPGQSTLMDNVLARPIANRQPVLMETISNLEFSNLVELATKPISPGTHSSKANSEPNLENRREVLKGRLKKLKPKQRCNFLKGCVLRWDDFTTTLGRLDQKQEKVTVLSRIDQDSDKEKLTKPSLKVYSRNKAKRSPKIYMDPEMKQPRMEEIDEGACSDCEGDKQLVLRPEYSSTSSFSESEESFLSDSHRGRLRSKLARDQCYDGRA